MADWEFVDVSPLMTLIRVRDRPMSEDSGKRTLEQLKELSDPVRLPDSVRDGQPDHRAVIFVNNFDPLIGRRSTLHGFVGGELGGNSRRFRFRCKPVRQISADQVWE